MGRFALVLAALALSVGGTGCTIIDDGEVGVLKSFGSIRDEPLARGPNLVFPVVRQIEKWNIKRQEIKETADTPSSEGLIVRLETSLQFRVMPDKAPFIRKSTGRNYREILIIPYFRNEVRDVVSAYPVRNIYSEEGRNQIAARVLENLQKSLAPEGIEVLAVLMRDIQLPARFKESIEAKLTAEQRVQQKGFELQQARKDAEIEIARAEGAAKAQQIVRSTLSDSYLQYLWIKTLNENPNVIYVATEANMPIFKNVK
jgi:regulator of protease activity HflC (stomatin/prohibitin superfamily)